MYLIPLADMPDQKTDLQPSLLKLVGTIQKIVAAAKEKKTIAPEDETFFQWKVRDFQYTDAGIKNAGADGNYVTKRTWFRASLVLEKEISAHADFESALADLEKVYPATSGADRHLSTFVQVIMYAALENEDEATVRREAGSTTKRFIDELSGAPVANRAKVEVVGITLQPQLISLEPGVTIRQPKKEDLETISRPFDFMQQAIKNPSAIIDIELRSARPQNAALQAKVEQCIAALRLFNVGSVKWTTYEMSSDSLLNVMRQGTLGSGDRGGALETYLIRREDETRFQQFWHTLNLKLPKDIYDVQKQISHLTLAYDRYSDALLHNGIIERRIANAVMGLEALFLEENLELSFRLGVRISMT